MIVNTNKTDAMVLLIVMDSMRENVSDTLRKNFGRLKGRKLFKRYEKIANKVEEQLLLIADEPDETEMKIDFTEEQCEMMKEFLSTCIDLLEGQAEKEEKEVEEIPWYNSLNNIVFALLLSESEEIACESAV